MLAHLLSSKLTRAAVCVTATALVACGSDRLQTAAEPAVVPPIGGAAGTDAAGGSSAGDDGANAGGAPPLPIETEELVGFAEFEASFTVGPVHAERIEVNGLPFTSAWRLSMAEPPTSPLHGQLVLLMPRAVAAGQLLRVSFWVRCATPGETGDCYTEYLFERASAPWQQSVTFPAHADATWAEKAEYFQSAESYAAGESQMVFRLGFAGQTIEIAGLTVQRIGLPP